MYFDVTEKYEEERVKELYSHITVSRSDINLYSVDDRNINDRFYMLPVENYLTECGVTPRPAQIPVLNALNDPKYRFIVCPLARRSGKSFIAYEMGFLKALEPNTNILIMSADYSLCGIGWNHIVKLIAKFGIETDKMNAKDREIYMKNGSMIKLGSVGKAGSCVGRSYDLIIFDECALHPKGGDAFQVELLPTLDKPLSKCLFISTPRGKNWYYEFFMRGFDEDKPEWVSVHATVYANPDMAPQLIATARRDNTKAYFEQEYMASFEVAVGQIYGEFDDDNIADLSRMDFPYAEFETIYGLDFGFKDPDAVVCFKRHMDTGLVYLVAGFEESGTTTDVLADNIHKLVHERGDPDMFYADSAAAQSRQDLAVLYDIATMPAKKDVLAGINYVGSLIAKKQLIVDESLTDIIWAFKNYFWKVDSDVAKPEHNEASHYMDAVRYALYSGRIE